MEKAKKVKKSKEEKSQIRLKREFHNPTPKGEKKDMTQPMLKEYDPPAVEAAWYDWWEAQGFYKADEKDQTKEKFVIVIPPPNVTGSLHMGHALTNSIQDALCRWHRMSGKNVLWVPGTDHAGIATQVVVEKKLKKERNLTRHDLGRERFIEEVWRWKNDYGAQICNQLRRLGSSLDWSREVFTMDEKLSKAVIEAFVRMYDQGLIYRGTRLVNWCTELKTAISDVEVEHKDLPGRHKMKVPGYGQTGVEFGVLTSFAYPIENLDEQIVVSTTRIETMLGDTAIAVHPNDARYKHLHGKHAVHPFNNRRIPIITDAILVEMNIGTGAVKITPAHDPKDYECGKRHGLDMINIFTDDGLINEEGIPFTGMKRFEARVAVAKALEEKGLLKESQDNPMKVPICSRTKDVIEPRLKPQWWVKCSGMAAEAAKAVKEKRLEIIPSMHEAVWFRWLENIQDWCISRQLWWGHRIPAYLIYIEGRADPEPEDQNNWVVGRTYEEALKRAIARHADVQPDKIRLEQDPDVLDTWFSAGLFPFSVFGWPEKTADLKAFYPTSLLETGHDILFFWVARMVMMGLNLTGQLPFSKVFLHAMVRDAHGRKMSKSLGNVVDPIDVTEGIRLADMQNKLLNGNLNADEIQKAKEGQTKDFPNGISECGTDAMRFALCAYTSQGRDINLDINRVVSYRHFCNKLWNATKFALMNLGADYIPLPSAADTTGHEGTMEKWILSRLHSAIKDADQGWETLEFASCTTAIYNFWLYELCDVYLEAIKPAMRNKGSPEQKAAQHTLYTCFEFGLRLLHPLMPFISEELYQRLPRRPGDTVPSIMLSTYPKTEHSKAWANESLEADVSLAQDTIRAARALRTENNLPLNAKPTYFLELQTEELRNTFKNFVPIILTLSGASEINIIEANDKAPSGCAVNILNERVKLHIFLKGLIDPDAEIKKLEKKLKDTTSQLEGLDKRVKAPQYEEKVPAEVKKSNAERLSKLGQEIEAIHQAIDKFKLMKA